MPAVVRFGAAACVAVIACSSGKAGPAQMASLEPSARDVTGPYWCTIDQDGADESRYPCMIKQVGDRLMLAKLSGSPRLRGRLTLDQTDGFTFAGELYCPGGSCTQELRGRFGAAGRGGWTGTLTAPLAPRDERHQARYAVVVHLMPAPANAFDGQGYGGDGYGDPFGAVDKPGSPGP